MGRFGRHPGSFRGRREGAGASFGPGRSYGVTMVPAVVFAGSVGFVCGAPADVGGVGFVLWELSIMLMMMMGALLTLSSDERNGTEVEEDAHTEQTDGDTHAHADTILVPIAAVTDGRNWSRPKRMNPTHP